MMIWSVYEINSGRIVAVLQGDEEFVALNLMPGQDAIEGHHNAAIHYIKEKQIKYYPAQPGAWAKFDLETETWIDPRTPKDLSTDLEMQKRGALEKITRLRGQARLSYITDLPGQDMLYIAKAEEAAAYLVDPDSVSTDYPLIQSEVGVTAPTAYEVAQVFANLNSLWKHAAGLIDAACFQAEAAVMQAPDEQTILTILHGLESTII